MYLAEIPTEISQSVLLREVYFHSIDQMNLGIVLTPACDIAQGKAELVLVCAVFPAKGLLEHLFKVDWSKVGSLTEEGELVCREELSTGKEKQIRNQLLRLIGQQYPRFHWLCPFPEIPSCWVIDFQTLASFPQSELKKCPILAGLNSPFKEQVSSRFSAYAGRIGTPDLPKDEFANQLVDELFGTK